MNTRERGSAIIVVIILILLIAGLSTALFALVVAQNRTTFATVSATDATYVLQAGIGAALQELRANRNMDGDGNGDGVSDNADIGFAAGSFGGGDYGVRRTNLPGNIVLLTGVGRKNGVRRGAEVRVRLVPPIPPTPAAVNLSGPNLAKKGKIDLHVKQHEEDEPADWSSTSTSPVAIDGNDQAGLFNVPGVAIEDPITLDLVADKIADRMESGKLSTDAVLGTPMVPIGNDKNGDGQRPLASIQQISDMSLDSATMGGMAELIEARVDEWVADNATTKITQNNKTATNGTLNWGGSPDSVTYLSANSFKVGNNATINGQGILIVDGDMTLDKGSTLNWDGTIIVMGGKNKDSKLKNNQGTVNIDGNVLVVGTGPTKKKSKLELHDDHGTNNQTNTITGSILVISGNRTNEDDKAEVKIKHGQTTVNGVISIVGDKVKFDVHTHDHKEGDREGGFRLNGSLGLAVWGDDDKHKAKVHLHGENILVHFHSVNVDNALSSLAAVGGKIKLPLGWSIVAWREIPAPFDLP